MKKFSYDDILKEEEVKKLLNDLRKIRGRPPLDEEDEKEIKDLFNPKGV